MNKLNFYMQHLERLTNKKVLLEKVLMYWGGDIDYADGLTPEEESENPYICISYNFELEQKMYKVDFVADADKQWDMRFGLDAGEGYAMDFQKLTGDNRAITVLSTVFTIVNEFLHDYSQFVDVLSIEGTDPKRKAIYPRIAPKYIKPQYLRRIRFS